MSFWNLLVGLTWVISFVVMANGLDVMMKEASTWKKILALVAILAIIIIGPK